MATNLVVSGLPAGAYRLTLHNPLMADTDESRLALFYDARPACAVAATGSEGR